MNRHLRESAPPLLVFALMLACAAGWALGPRGASAAGEGRGRQQQREGATEPEVTVYGRAVYEGSGRPVRRARVMLMSAEQEGRTLAATTDGRGEFRFRGVKPGRYYVSVDQPGLLTPVSFLNHEELRSGLVDLADIAKNFEVFEVDGKADKEVTARARRGASITGRVSYADGEPATGITVHVMRRADGRLMRVVGGGMYRATFSAGLRTDDRGVFRAAGLPPGEYLLAVSEPAEHGEPRSREPYSDAEYAEESMPNHLLLTFHPSASRVHDAAAVKVEAGDEREGVNIVIPDRELRTLTGVVRARRGGRPIPNATVHISRKDDEFGPDPLGSTLATNGTLTDEQGRWQLRDIPDGAYTIVVAPQPEPAQGEAYMTTTNANVSAVDGNVSPGGNFNAPRHARHRPVKRYASARLDVQVGAAGNELEVELSDTGRISGAVSVEGAKGDVGDGRVYAVRVLKPEAAASSENIYSSQVADGEFALEGLAPGEYFIRHSISGEGTSRLYIKAIVWNGRDFTREPLPVAEGQQVEGVRVVFSSDAATLSVRVTEADKRPAGRVYVLLGPPDTSGWAAYSQQSYCVTDAEGACEVGAAPGTYAVVAYRVAGRPLSDEDWKRLFASAPRVTLRAGDPKTLELNLPAAR